MGGVFSWKVEPDASQTIIIPSEPVLIRDPRDISKERGLIAPRKGLRRGFVWHASDSTSISSSIRPK